MLKCDQFGGKGGANLPPKRTSNTIGTRGGGTLNYYDDDDDDDNDDDDDEYDDFDDDYDVFSGSQRTYKMIGTRGAR